MTLDIEGARKFHGHSCPGLAMGIRVAEIALREIGPHSADEEIVAIVETDNCAVDGIQYLTGCTFGKGNLIHLDYGKNAFTFIRRSDGKAIRVVSRPDTARAPDPERAAILERVRVGEASEEDHRRAHEMRQQTIDDILARPLEELFDVQDVEPVIPARARVFTSLTCDACGEVTMETRTRRFGGRTLCIPCFQALESRM